MRNVLLLLVVSIAGCGGGSDSTETIQRDPGPKWYQGGTLQNATLGEWRAATPVNRLASSADFAAVVAKRNNLAVKSMDDLALIAEQIEQCITKVASDGESDQVRVPDTAAACAVLMTSL